MHLFMYIYNHYLLLFPLSVLVPVQKTTTNNKTKKHHKISGLKPLKDLNCVLFLEHVHIS